MAQRKFQYFNNYKNENKDAVVNDLIVEMISDREEIYWKQEKEKEKWDQWESNPKKVLVVYGVVVSVLFTMTALFQFFSLTPDGLRFGHKICIEEGLEMGQMACEAWEVNPPSFSPAGEDLFDMLKRTGIMIGILWFPYITYKWYKKRKAEGLYYLKLKEQYEEIEKENTTKKGNEEFQKELEKYKYLFDGESDTK